MLRSSPVFPIAASVCVPLGGGVLHQLSVAASVCVPLGGGVLHKLSVAASVCVPLGGDQTIGGAGRLRASDKQ